MNELAHESKRYYKRTIRFGKIRVMTLGAWFAVLQEKVTAAKME